MYWHGYHLAQSVDEALSVLESYRGKAQVIAGGTDLALQIKERERNVGALVDISRLPDLKEVREDGVHLRIGALCTHSQLAQSSLIRLKATALAEAAASIGSPQIRNIGTVGGNVVNAQPAADTSIALLALDAKAVIRSSRGKETRLLEEMFVTVGRSAVDSRSQILTEFLIPLGSGFTASSFQRLARRKAVALPILNVAVSLELRQDRQSFERVNIAVGPVAPVPWRAREAEAVLKAAPTTEEVIRQACSLAAEKATPRDSLRGSATYRKQMVKVLVYRAIRAAIERSGGAVHE